MGLRIVDRRGEEEREIFFEPLAGSGAQVNASVKDSAGEGTVAIADFGCGETEHVEIVIA